MPRFPSPARPNASGHRVLQQSGYIDATAWNRASSDFRLHPAVAQMEKATGLGKFFPFYVSANEVRCSEAEPGRYHLYRVFDFTGSAKLYVLQEALSKVCRLEPIQYRASQ